VISVRPFDVVTVRTEDEDDDVELPLRKLRVRIVDADVVAA